MTADANDYPVPLPALGRSRTLTLRRHGLSNFNGHGHRFVPKSAAPAGLHSHGSTAATIAPPSRSPLPLHGRPSNQSPPLAGPRCLATKPLGFGLRASEVDRGCAEIGHRDGQA